MSTASPTPIAVLFAELQIGDEIRAFPTADTGVEFADRVEDRSTHTLWIGRTHGPRRIVHDIDGYRFELVRPGPRRRGRSRLLPVQHGAARMASTTRAA